MPAASGSSSSDAYDIVCVGGGHNALVAAALLARSGRSVAVLDRNDRPGGFVRTEEIIPGFLIDRFSAAHPQFTAGPAYAALADDLRAHGLTYVNTDRPTGVSMPDGSTAILPRDRAELFAEADRLAPGDGLHLEQMIDELGPVLGDLFPLFGQELAEPTSHAALARLLRDEEHDGFTPFAASLFGSARSALQRLASPTLRAMLGSWATHAGVGPLDAGSALWSKVFLLTFLQGGLPVPRGGSGRLAQALTSLIRDLGGVVITSTEVTGIDTHDGRAVAVRTAAGDRLRANEAVIASVNPDQLYLRLLPERDVAAPLRAQARAYRYGSGQVQVNLALSRPPEWPDPRFATVGQPFLTDGLEGLALHVTHARCDYLPALPTISVAVPSALDDSRAPAGQAVMRIQVTDVPTRPQGDAAGVIDTADGRWTPDVTARFVDRVLDVAEAHLPGLRQSVLASAVESPATIADYNPNAGPGDAYGGALDLAQHFVFRPLPGQPRHRTSIGNLYMVGAATWPGAGVSGASGHLVARTLLDMDTSS